MVQSVSQPAKHRFNAFWNQPVDNERKDSIIKKAMQNMGKPIDEITRRNTYRARSPGVKPTTGIKLILPKTSTMAEKIQKVLDGDDPK